MKLYKISQDVNNDYDTYSDAVVCASTPEEAQKIHPSDYHNEEVGEKDEDFGSWCGLKDVQVEEIGDANENIKKGVVCASFHAG